jgi:hypothetical protein
MLGNILTVIVAVSVLAPLALVPSGASAQSMSVLPTFSPATIQQPRTMKPTYGAAYGRAYSYPSVKWGCGATSSQHYGWSWNWASAAEARQHALEAGLVYGQRCRIKNCAPNVATGDQARALWPKR